MSQRRLAVFVGDAGSAIELAPVVKELVKREIEVKVFADPHPKGAGRDKLAKKGVAYEERFPGEEDGRFDLFLIGASVTAADYHLRAIREGAKREITTVLYEDMAGTAARPNVRDDDPDVMLVIDDTARDVVRATRPKMRDIVVVGKPSFSDIPGIVAKAAQHRTDIRGRLGVTDEETLVTFWSMKKLSSVKAQAETLRNLPITLAARFHPVFKDQPEVIADLKASLQGGRARIVDASQETPEPLSIASDAVVAAWNATEGYRAMLAGQPVIIASFPDETKERKDAGFADAMPPHLKAGAVLDAHTPDDLFAMIRRAKNERVQLVRELEEKRRPFLLHLEPGAVGRIADALIRCLRG